MEYIGYILHIVNTNHYYGINSMKVKCPFNAKFYINKEKALEDKQVAENIYKSDVELIKVKKIMKKID